MSDYHEDEHLEMLRRLLGDDTSIERVQRELHAFHFGDRAAAATVEALMHVLRTRGPKALKEAWVQTRLAMLAEEQLHEVAARLQKLKPEIAKAWTTAEIERLTETWIACHA
jgi:hypothetical protein